MRKSEVLAQLMQRRLTLCLPPGRTTAAWHARRAFERLFAAWPTAFLSLLADMDGLRLVVHEGESRLSAGEFPSSLNDCPLTLFLDLAQLADLHEDACQAAASLAAAVIDACEAQAGADQVGRYAEFRRRLETAHQLRYTAGQSASDSPQSYLEWACARYLSHRQELASQDPPAYHLLHSTVFSDSFWTKPELRTPGAESRE